MAIDWFATNAPKVKAESPKQDWFASNAPKTEPPASALSRFASGVGEMINPVTAIKGLAQSVAHPFDTVAAIYAQQGKTFDQAVEDYRKGRYSEMVGHGAASILPVVGPLAAGIGEQAATGDIAGAAGKTAGLLLGGELLKAGTKLVPKAIAVAPKVTREAELARFGLEQGVPVDVASATANPIPRAAQKLTTHASLLGSGIGTKALKARQQGLATLGEQLASKGYPQASVTKELAGEAARTGVENSIREFAQEADQHYSKLRELEQKNPQPVTTGSVTKTVQEPTGAVDASGNPILQSVTRKVATSSEIGAPVDLQVVRPSLKPVLDALMRKKELVGTLQGVEGRAAVALDKLVNGKDFAALADVDAALGDLKAMTRGTSMPELRTSGQGAAAFAVKHLEQSVAQAAKNLGPEAEAALKAGRAATVQKYAAADVLDALNKEPVKTANAAVAPKDAAIAHLRDLQKFAPEALPQVGKAVLSEMLTQATEKGGFDNARTLATKWNNLGPETKRLLFRDPQHVKDLDKFWALAEKASENPNPSGTAYLGGIMTNGALMLTNPVTHVGYEIAGATLAKALSSPTVTRAMIEGFSIPLRAKTAAAARYGRLTNLIQQATRSGASPSPAPAGSK